MSNRVYGLFESFNRAWACWTMLAVAPLILTACNPTIQTTPPGSATTVGGTISGLTGSGLVLIDGTTQLTLAAGATGFTFPNAVASGSSYAVTVQNSPAGFHCSVNNGAGAMGATSVTNVAVSCSALDFTVGGTVSGLSAAGLVLGNGVDQLTVANGATSFVFPTAVPYSSAYAVTVLHAPSGLTCSAAGATGTMGTANVNNVVVTCSAQSFALAGTVTGLTSTGLVLANGSNRVTVPAGASGFSMAAVAFTSSYAVTVAAQPGGESCIVNDGIGTMLAADFTRVAVTCSDQPYTLGGTINGLSSAGLVLANGADQLTIASGSTGFTMPTSVDFGSSYAVTIATQPAGMICTVSAAAGTMPATNVGNVTVVCADRSYALGGSIQGLNGTGLVLANGTDQLAVAAGALSFSLANSVAFGSSYAVTVATQPTGVTCIVSAGSGTMPATSVSSVAVACVDHTYTLGGTILGLSTGGLVLTDGIDALSVASNAAVFSMPTGLAYASNYSVTIAVQPAPLNCAVAGGSGTMPAANVSSVQLTCAARYWTWQGGSQTHDVAGVAGTQGTAAAGNHPGARDGDLSWNGNTSQRWLFGGSGQDVNNNGGDLSDLWSYNQNTGLWTWVKGPDTRGDDGTYGTQGTAAVGNVPSSRHQAMGWMDATGTLWLFGGYHDDVSYGPVYGYLNDLWSYNPSTGYWTWVSGSGTPSGSNTNCPSDAGVYGAQGVAAAGNVPGARLAAVTWIDGAGTLWLHGGFGCDSTGALGTLNDLWSYNRSTNHWTWVSGAATVSASGSYGTEGVAAVANVPGARVAATGWVDGNGNLWLFGGYGQDSAGTSGQLNDLWTFSPTAHTWTWAVGSELVNSSGIYGATGNTPSSRNGAQGWVDSGGHFVLFGGNGQDSQGNAGWLNDLWSYDPTVQAWTWVSGSSTISALGVYGSLGVGAAANVPGARFQSVGWIDESDHLWVFGGYGWDNLGNQYEGALNDLFEY